MLVARGTAPEILVHISRRILESFDRCDPGIQLEPCPFFQSVARYNTISVDVAAELGAGLHSSNCGTCWKNWCSRLSARRLKNLGLPAGVPTFRRRFLSVVRPVAGIGCCLQELGFTGRCYWILFRLESYERGETSGAPSVAFVSSWVYLPVPPDFGQRVFSVVRLVADLGCCL